MSRKIDYENPTRYKRLQTQLSRRQIINAKKDALKFAARIAEGRHSKKKAGPVRVYTPEEREEWAKANLPPITE